MRNRRITINDEWEKTRKKTVISSFSLEAYGNAPVISEDSLARMSTG
jgi:hypothetical protein